MATFVGRTLELERLDARLDAALGGKGGLVFVTGDAGAGKSCLVKRFLQEAALRAPEARIMVAECSEQYGAGEPYQPFVETLHDLVGGEGKPVGKASLRNLIREVAPYWLSTIPIAGDIIAATVETAAGLRRTLDGEIKTAVPPSEEALFFQYTEILLAAVAENPVVLCIDDLHWADRASVALLAHVARKIHERAILIVGTYRPSDVEVSNHPVKQARLELERYGVAEELQLKPLDKEALDQLVFEELGGPSAPEFRRWLSQHAGSNPLFFTELLKWSVEQRVVGQQHGEWVFQHVPEEIEIPRSAEAVIEKRLGRLEPDLYRLLEYASVEGNEFWSTTLARLLGIDELRLEEMIEPLVQRDRLVRFSENRQLPSGDSTSVYEFRHSLIQAVLHRNLRGKRRLILHRTSAEILEDVYSFDSSTVSHKLATHYHEGRQPDRAYACAVQAAERASRVYAHWDALALLQLALANCETDEQRIEVLDRLGEEDRLIGRFSEALENFGKALREAEETADRRRAISIKRKTARVEREYGEWSPHELHGRLTDLAREARELGARSELCEILWSISGLPEIHGAGDAVREALAIAEELGDNQLIARAHFELGAVLIFGDDPANGVPHFRQGLRLYRELGERHRVALCHNGLGIAHTLIGKYRSAAAEFVAAATVFDELADPVNEASTRSNLGVLLTRLGDWEGAESNLQEALRLTRRMGATARVLHPTQNLAELCQAMDDRESARDHWEECLELARETGYWNAEIISHCGLGTIWLEEGDLSGARRELEAAQTLVKDPDAWTESREVLELFAARVTAVAGHVGEAVRMLDAAEETMLHRDRYLWATYRLTHGELLLDIDRGAARLILREALEAFEQLGAEPMRQRAASLLVEQGGSGKDDV